MAVFFTSDTHFGDTRVLRLDRRPFASLHEHDEALIGWWNEVVGPHDEVWHLGDFVGQRLLASADALLGRLNGTKHLIIGNNDPARTLSAAGWASVGHYREMTVEGVDVVLCHYPFRTWNGMGKGRIDLHGHSHGRLKPVPQQFDVGVDARHFRPMRISEIAPPPRSRSVNAG
jgi:calcineurin-like phosphoesterase family protein